MNAEDEMLQKLEENDKYMQQKISKQLDRLVGPGNYVATVSTFLRQAPLKNFQLNMIRQKKLLFLNNLLGKVWAIEHKTKVEELMP